MKKNSDPALYQSFLTARDCHRRGNLAGAEAIYSRLLALDPADEELLFLFGHLQVSKGALDIGLECLDMAHRLKPSNPQIPFSIGVVLQGAGRLPEAVESYRSALAIEPRLREALENLCAACYDLDDYETGLDAASRALALDPGSALAVRGAANCLAALGRRKEALAVLEGGIVEHPAQPELRIHHAWELMANGLFEAGWKALEWRHSNTAGRDAPPRSVPWPRWNGEPPAGKTILVYGEQGIGDEIMFAPFVADIMRAGGRCILECEPRLESLFATAFPGCELLRRENQEQIAWRSALSAVDFCIPAQSLPLHFPHSAPRQAFLAANPERVAHWRERLRRDGAGLKVGVSWRGGADAKARKIRSIAPAIFAELLAGGAADFIALQYGATSDEVAAISPALRHFPEVDALGNFDEFAALVSALDVVVSVDNSTVHLAGALGVKTLVLLPVYSEWRWGNAESGTSPWYLSVALMRQPVASEAGWRSLLAQAREWIAACGPASAGPGRGAPAPAANVLPAATDGRSALLVGDTHYWYHWGCACTSLGLHEGLRTRFETLRVLPLRRLLSGCPQPAGRESLDSDEFFAVFEQTCPDIAAAMLEVDCVVINGEGSIHGSHSLPALLLYLAYIASRRYGKRVALVNHSCYPGEGMMPDGATSAGAYYGQVYSRADVVVLRERLSLANVSPFNSDARLGFDCLPLFLATHGSIVPAAQRKLLLGGSVAWSPEMVECFATLAGWMHNEGFAVEILSGAKAFLASDEVGFVAAMAKALRKRGIPHELRFPVSEREWLEAIGSAALVVSGRFHYSIAAAFQRIPFLVAESNTAKISGLLAELSLSPTVVALAPAEYGKVIDKASALLGDHALGTASVERLEALRLQARTNFLAL